MLAVEAAGREQAAVREEAKSLLPRKGQESRLTRAWGAWGAACVPSKCHENSMDNYHVS